MGFFKKKVERIKVPLRQTNIGELTIRLMRSKDRLQADNPYLDALGSTKAFFIMCPTNVTIESLRERLSGICQTPSRILYLHYCGKTLKDEDKIPKEAFEYVTKEESDDEIFKPRIYLEITFDPNDHDAPETQQRRLMRIQREREEAEAKVLAELKRQKEIEEEIKLKKEAELKKIALKLEKKEKAARFDLKGQLEKIDCGIFYNMLRDAGFEDEGSFSHMVEEDLIDGAVYIPRLARIRILSLRDAILRKLEAIYKAKHGKAYEEISAAMNLRVKVVEGTGKQYKTKKEAQDAWIKKAADEEAARLYKLYGPQPKKHAVEIQEKIDQIRRDLEVDEYGIKTKNSHLTLYEPSIFCCRMHKKNANDSRQKFLDSMVSGSLAELEVMVARSDTYHNGFISRENLISLGMNQLSSIVKAPIEIERESGKKPPENETYRISKVGPPPDYLYEGSPGSKPKSQPELSPDERDNKRDSHANIRSLSSVGLEHLGGDFANAFDTSTPTKNKQDNQLALTTTGVTGQKPGTAKKKSLEEQERENAWFEKKDALYSQVVDLVNSCRMSTVDMNVSQDWAGRNEIEANMANIPSERYDLEEFVNGMKVLLAEEIQTRFDVKEDTGDTVTV